MPRYEIRADEDIDSPVVVWRGDRKPTRADVNAAAKSACERGWNGVELDLYDGDRWVEWVYPSASVLA